MSKSPDIAGKYDKYTGECPGPLAGACGREITLLLPLNGKSDPNDKRVRCSECGAIAPVSKHIQ